MSYIKLSLSVAAGCLLAYSVVALHHWAWEESQLTTFWLIALAATLIVGSARAWITGSAQVWLSVRSLLSNRRLKVAGGFAAAVFVCYLIGVAIHLR